MLANVYLLSKTAARAFNAGKIPGAIVTDELLAVVEREAASPDKGRAFFVELAEARRSGARPGLRGRLPGRPTPASTFGEILDRAASFGANDWRGFAREIQYPFADEFYSRARPGDEALVRRRQPGIPRLEAEPQADLRPHPVGEEGGQVGAGLVDHVVRANERAAQVRRQVSLAGASLTAFS